VLRKANIEELQKKFPHDSWLNIDKEAWRTQFREHHENVFSYFNNRPKDLLVINITTGDGWGKLCPFLEKNIPNRPFPCENVRTKVDELHVNRKKTAYWLKSKIKSIIRHIF